MVEEINRKNPVFEALKLSLEKELSDLLENNSLQKTSRRNKTLYHYTNLSGLKAIVENQCFFSSNSAYLNKTLIPPESPTPGIIILIFILYSFSYACSQPFYSCLKFLPFGIFKQKYNKNMYQFSLS